MLRIRNTLFQILLLTAFLSQAQQSEIYSEATKAYQDAKKLYNSGQYQSAYEAFSRVSAKTALEETRESAKYYMASAAIRMNRVGAEKQMEDFVKNYPASVKKTSAYLEVADYYFENGRYAYALTWYKKTDRGSVPPAMRDRYDFNLGYSLYATRNVKDAERVLSRVATSEEYGEQAQYYLGYMAYERDDYEGANQRFEQIPEGGLKGGELSYFQADMNFKNGDFEEAIKQAKEQLPKSDRQEASELNKIIGESYFNLGDYATAIPYLEAYRGKRGKWSNTDFYQLGYCYYKQEDYANAIQQFNKIIDGDNEVAQNAYYHLAECYLELGQKQQALNAFRRASQMEFVAEIQTDAMLNYARLSYEIGNPYEAVPKVLGEFLSRHPAHPAQGEIRRLLVDSYITSKDFEGALALLGNKPQGNDRATYQIVSFYRALELFTDESYREALNFLDKSLNYAEEGYYESRALFWRAETNYALRDVESALADYLSFSRHPSVGKTEEYSHLDYQLAYCYFKLKDYSSARDYLQRYTSKRPDGPRLWDAYLRLGDSNFASSRYEAAISAYQNAIDGGNPEMDYAAYQIALSQGLLGRISDKIGDLEDFLRRFPESTLRDDALFELGNTFISENEETTGLDVYERLIKEYPGSSLVSQAILRQGLVHYNANRYNEALGRFKKVVREYPDSQEAVQAVNTARLIYIDLGRVDEYAQWVSDLEFVELTDTDLDNATFESANKKLMEGDNNAAVAGFEKYLQQFPNGLHGLEANMNLANLLFEQERKQESLPFFRKVVDMNSNEYTEKALTRICEILIVAGDRQAAIPYLLQLEGLAKIPQNRTFARSNLMKAYFEQQQYREVLSYAREVLNTPGIDQRIKSDAQLMLARASWETGDMELAEQAYTDLLQIASGAQAAEALYYMAYFENKKDAYERSNEIVQQIAREYSTYKEWGAKGLLIMAKNFDSLDDAFQATYILESIQTNFQAYPEIVEEARVELERIKAKEAERNASLEPGGN